MTRRHYWAIAAVLAVAIGSSYRLDEGHDTEKLVQLAKQDAINQAIKEHRHGHEVR